MPEYVRGKLGTEPQDIMRVLHIPHRVPFGVTANFLFMQGGVEERAAAQEKHS